MTARYADTPPDSVTAELEATLERVKTALEIHCEDPDAPGPLDDIVRGLRDVRGACVLLEQHEAAQQAGELLGWAERLMHGQTEDAEGLRARLLESVLRLARYLAWRHRSRHRAEAAPPAPVIDLTAFALDLNTLRSRFQRTLLGLLRGDKLDHHLDQLATVLMDIKALCPAGADYDLWWHAQGLAESLRSDGRAPSRTQNLLLRELDQRLRLLAQHGPGALPPLVLAELLGRLELEVSASPVGKAWLRNRIDYTPGASGTEPGARADVLADPDTLSTIGLQLAEQLALAKGALETRTRTGVADAPSLQEELSGLRSVANLLWLIDMPAPAALLRRWLERLDELAARNASLDDDDLFGLAHDVVLVENSVEGITEFAYAPPPAVGDDPLAAIAALEVRRARAATANAAGELLQDARTQIDARLRGEGSDELWPAIARLIDHVASVLRMLEAEPAVQLVKQIRYAIGRVEADPHRLDAPAFAAAVAEAIVVAEYFVDRLAQGRPTDEDVLERARVDLIGACGGPVPDWDLPERWQAAGNEAPADTTTPDFELTLPALELPPASAAGDTGKADQTDRTGETARPTVVFLGDDALPPLDLDSLQLEMPGPATGRPAPDAIELIEPAEPARPAAATPAGLAATDAPAGETALPSVEFTDFDDLGDLAAFGLKPDGSSVHAPADDSDTFAPPQLPADLWPQTPPAPARHAAGERALSWPDDLPELAIELPAAAPPAPVADEAAADEPADAALPLVSFTIPEPVPAPEPAGAATPAVPTPPPESALPLPAAALDIDPDLLDVFLEEAAGEFESIRAHLAQTEGAAPGELEGLRSIRRSFHTLKGSGRMVGERVVGEFAWGLENLFNQILAGRRPFNAEVQALTAEGTDALEHWLASRDAAAYGRLTVLELRTHALLEGRAPSEADVDLEAETPAAAETLTPAPAPEPAPAPAPAVTETFAPAPLPPPLPDWVEALLLVLDDCRAGSTTARDALIERLAVIVAPLASAEAVRVARALEDYLQALCRHGRGLDAADILLCEDCASALQAYALGETIDPGALGELLNALARRAAALPSFAAPLPAEPQPVLPAIDPELAAVFLAEAADILDAADVTLSRWRQDRHSAELLNDLRREMHTLKGSSRMAGFPQIGDLAHATESLLDACAGGKSEPTDALADGMQRALDHFSTMLTEVEANRAPAPAAELIHDLADLLEHGAPVPAPAPAAATAATTTTAKPASPAGTAESVRVSSTLLDNLVNQMGESSIYRARIEQGVSAVRFNLGELDQIANRLRAQLRRLEIETEAQILFRYERGGVDPNADFDPLELDRFSELQQLSRQLLEAAEDLANIQSSLVDQTGEIGGLLEQQGKVNKELQQGLMQTRVVRFETVAARLKRVVRQAADDAGKSAELHIDGGDAEIERNLLEGLVAPLEHLLRNAVSHGIESPERRHAAGKDATGAIRLALRREGAEILLSVADDGAGLNYAAIRASAEKRGLLAANAQVSDAQLADLLLLPGFSTAQALTQLSGRGVGLDVVASAVSSMRGALSIQSQPGKGVTFQLRLPFSLSLTQALLVRAGEDIYAVPLLSVEAVSRLSPREFRDYLAGHTAEHDYAGSGFAVHSLAAVFGGALPAAGSSEARPPVLLFRSADMRAAIQVDAVLGRQEIIVKPVGPQLSAVPGVSGATVLADGRVVIILDMPALVRGLASAARRAQEAAALRAARQADERAPLSILVVDDSITMRKVTARVLERHGVVVELAKDGVDAVEVLDQLVPDLVILDIEMPRMDGFELVGHIRNQARLRHLPVIMVTSRTGEKHRDRAARLGVNAYLGKPYQEEELLGSIRDVLGSEGARRLRSL